VVLAESQAVLHVTSALPANTSTWPTIPAAFCAPPELSHLPEARSYKKIVLVPQATLRTAQAAVIPVPRAHSKPLAQATALNVPRELTPQERLQIAPLSHAFSARSTNTGPSAGACQRTVAVESIVFATPATMSLAISSVWRAKKATSNLHRAPARALYAAREDSPTLAPLPLPVWNARWTPIMRTRERQFARIARRSLLRVAWGLAASWHANAGLLPRKGVVAALQCNTDLGPPTARLVRSCQGAGKVGTLLPRGKST